MKVIVNGSTREYGDDKSLADLIGELGAVSERVAMLLNERVIPVAERDRVRLKDGDRVEILTFMGGG
jgi:sulfur carrier protein